MIPSTSKVASYIRNADEDANPTRQRDTITGWLAAPSPAHSRIP